jgi:hypothetical protein
MTENPKKQRRDNLSASRRTNRRISVILPELNWEVIRRPDCSPCTWEVRMAGENWTVDILPDGATCGCGQSNCVHIRVVLALLNSAQ